LKLGFYIHLNLGHALSQILEVGREVDKELLQDEQTDQELVV
jgi:hypothetical protein